MFGKEDVPGIAAIHYPLRHINPRTSYAGLIIHVDNPAHGTTVHTHSQCSSGCAFNTRLTSSAHSTGSSTLPRKTSAIPSPVGLLIKVPVESASRNVSVC